MNQELFEEMRIALNRSTALLMEIANYCQSHNIRYSGLVEFIDSQYELVKRINKDD